MSEDLKLTILKRLDSDGLIESTRVAFKDVPEETVLGALKSLESQEKVSYKTLTTEFWTIEPEGKDQLENGSYEARIFAAVPAGSQGVSMKDLEAQFGKVAKLGQGKCMAEKWLKKDGDMLVRLVDSVVDQVKANLEVVKAEGMHPDPSVIKDLKRRKLIKANKILSYAVKKGADFSTELKKQATDLTLEMLQSGAWKSSEFKKFNFDSLGVNAAGGHLHPLMKVREEFRQVFFETGFEEMPTNNFVESSFWNFDALFVPQQHPARKLQDTFFLIDPVHANALPDFWERVKDVHEKGGYGSIGYRYNWSEEEAKTLVLRTHTTAITAHMLHKLAQGPYRPAKYFSIDRVYRNEAVDATHLAEFHQVEGVIADKNMSLGSLIAFLDMFFKKMGMSNLRFKPTYNPYTEPSMEIFSYHEGLGRWLEIGNSGMFRPEMLRSLGLEEGVQVAGFGLSLERPTMFKYSINNIRELVGHKVKLSDIAANPACRLDKKMGREAEQQSAAVNKI
ncbi:Phenylalanyl-tRNA synthetase, beta subunit, cytoplasmic [Coemansia sp. RSA 2711]|nr:Phenylalanyl-tRNA synthetase, beta subunit, cytoplasmic [Coemansia sp. RSA 2711]KAJ2313987.1 Phenylalanyl-tRNA synthetase, beta subunit, cytoplasmic [Coemansia sp. RSA 2705]KAJ2363563.1 Phenylalanyl-tRNA synthetase, beta subunit, cytoplasmic [Coemansia sp. RSA 2610]KAJ2386791.1 Phenylalanyl-tRNA synthetase, beta subunit, cytoplasmic [Coemansia sp. RSA 2611]KAJ2728391.1 Phenylalanyl-tRNA synthetase, beta subunit, cytoplasmic [Coemansia sp. Cherry 401B]